MQHLEVSGAVRPLYGSLDVKALMYALSYYIIHARSLMQKKKRTKFHTHTHQQVKLHIVNYTNLLQSM